MSMAGGAMAAVQGIGDILGTVAMGKAAEAQANQQQAAGKLAQYETRRAGAELLGRERVAFAKSGVDLQTGTPAEVMSLEGERAMRASKLAKWQYQNAAYWTRHQAYQQGVSNFFSSLGSGIQTYLGGAALTGGMGSGSAATAKSYAAASWAAEQNRRYNQGY